MTFNCSFKVWLSRLLLWINQMKEVMFLDDKYFPSVIRKTIYYFLIIASPWRAKWSHSILMFSFKFWGRWTLSKVPLALPFCIFFLKSLFSLNFPHLALQLTCIFGSLRIVWYSVMPFQSLLVLLVMCGVSCWQSISCSSFFTFSSFFKFQTLLAFPCSQLMTLLFHWEKKKQSEITSSLFYQ